MSTFAAGCASSSPTRTVAAPDRTDQSDVASAMAAAAVELAPDTPDAIERADFTAIGNAIGNARVVLLGEPWHGDGGAIAARGRLVQYLHEHKQFDVVAYEADFFAVHEGWEHARKTGDLAMVRSQIYPFWSQTRAADPLWRYVARAMQRGDTLHVAGIDPKLAGPLSRERLPSLLADRLAAVPGITRTQALGGAASLLAALSAAPAAGPALTDSAFRALDAILAQLEQSVAVRGAAYGGLVAARALSSDDLFWGEVASSIRRNISGEQRDIGMGANLLWLALRQYAGHKIVVIAHNNHVASDKFMLFDSPDSLVATGGRPIPDSLRARTTLFGAEARRAFGARLFVIGATDFIGDYSADIAPSLVNLAVTGSRTGPNRVANFDSLATLEPAPPGTIEAALAARHSGLAFIDLRSFAGRGRVATRLLDYTRLGPTHIDLPRAFDGLLYLHRTFGVNQVRP